MWEGRFKSSSVDREYYCLACYRYIELNPVRAGMVRSPGEYYWSSFRGNSPGGSDPIITLHDVWLGLAESNDARQRAYLNLFDKALKQSELDRIRFGVNKGLPTGNDRFKSKIERALSVTLGDGNRGRPKTIQS